MTMPSFFVRNKTTFLVLGLPAIICLGTWALFLFAHMQDNPSNVRQTIKRPIKYLGTNGTVTLVCDCPSYLIQQAPRQLHAEMLIDLPGVKLAPAAEKLMIFPDANNSDVTIDRYSDCSTQKLASDGQASVEINFTVRSKGSDLSQVELPLITIPPDGGSQTGTVAMFSLPIYSRPPFLVRMRALAYAALAFALLAVLVYWTDRRLRLLRDREEKQFEAARTKAQDNPEKVSFAWEAASVNLQAYFKRNLVQVNYVFWVAVFVMIVGFGFVLAGVYLSFEDKLHITSSSKVAAVSGIITQFIGATFMVIYRSTMAQANEFVAVLDRINTVGMAVKVLDSIPESESAVKNATRQQLVRLLLSSNLKMQGSGYSSNLKTVPPAETDPYPG